MKIILFLRIWAGVFLMTCAADDFLAKFHQGDYKVKDLFAQIMYINESYIEKFELKTFKYNRSVTAFNASIITKYDTEDKVELLVQAYKRSSNAYRVFPVRFQINLCRLFGKNIAGLNEMMKHGNLTSCRAKKDLLYHIYNFVVDESILPPFIPTGEYRLDATSLYLQDVLAITMITAEVYHPRKPL